MNDLHPRGDFAEAFDVGAALSQAWVAIRRNLPLLWLGGCVRGCLRGGGGGGGSGEAERQEWGGGLLSPAGDAWAWTADHLLPPVGVGGVGALEAGVLVFAAVTALVVIAVVLAIQAWFLPGWIRVQAEIVRTGTSSLGTMLGGADAFGRMLGWILLKGALLLGVGALVAVPAVTALVSEQEAVQIGGALVAFVALAGLAYAWLGLLLGDHLVALDGARPLEALDRSWEWMDGNRINGGLFLLIVALVSGVFGLAGLCVFLIGALVTIPLSNALLDQALTCAYLRYTRSPDERAEWPEG
jgi:hypothetical protein